MVEDRVQQMSALIADQDDQDAVSEAGGVRIWGSGFGELVV